MSESEASRRRVDLLIVGAGPAGLSAAIHWAQEARTRGMADLRVLVVDKSPAPGAHSAGGFFLDPRGLARLGRQWVSQQAPLGPAVSDGGSWRLDRPTARRSKTPANLERGAGRLVELPELVASMAELAREEGVEIEFSTAVTSLLLDGKTVVGVRTGDRGVSSRGASGTDFTPGEEIYARLTLIADGASGVIGRQLRQLGRLSEERSPLHYSAGVSEIWQLSAPKLTAGQIRRAMGWPLPEGAHGGIFVSDLADDRLGLTLVSSLEGAGAGVNLPAMMDQVRAHTFVAPLLEEAELKWRCAGLLPDSGYWSVPKLAADGALLLGSAGGLLNPGRVAGVHLAVESGLAASQTALEVLAAGDLTSPRLMSYDRRVRDGSIGQELFAAGDLRQSGTRSFLGGWLRFPSKPRGNSLPQTAQSLAGGRRERSRQALSAAAPFHREGDSPGVFDTLPQRSYLVEQPDHVLVLDENLCQTRCAQEFGNPCQRFCPAGVFRFSEEDQGPHGPTLEPDRCVHCGVCAVADPYGNVVWTPPEGGDGPGYL